MPTIKLRYFLTALLLLQITAFPGFAQQSGASAQQSAPKYTIADITVSGTE
jgi:hypothetical protein